jgi:hypothetical protein
MELAIGSPKVSHLIPEEQALVRIFRDILNAYSGSRFSRSKGRGETLSDAEQELVRMYEDTSKYNSQVMRFDDIIEKAAVEAVDEPEDDNETQGETAT